MASTNTAPKDENNRYLFYFMRSSLMVSQFRRFSSGSGYPAITKKDMPRLEVAIPPDLSEQERIVKRIDEVMEEPKRVNDMSQQKWKVAIAYDKWSSHD